MPKGIYNRKTSRPRPLCSEEKKRKIRKALKGRIVTGMLGKHHSRKTKDKMRNAENSGFIRKEEHRGRKSEFKKGYQGGHHFEKGSTPWNKGLKGVMPSGKNHSQWKGGIDLENRRVRRSLEYEIWRNEVYKRDNWTCRICGKKCKPKDIIAHHLKFFSEYPELRFSVDNGITFCRACHAKIHKPRKKK